MKVTAKFYDHMTVESRPWFVAGITWALGLAILLGAFFTQDVGFGIQVLLTGFGLGLCAIAWWLMPFTALDFDRPDGTLVITHARITGATQAKYALSDIERTLVQIDNTDDAGLERLALKTSEGVTPIEFGFFATPRKAVMEDINAWLEMEKGA